MSTVDPRAIFARAIPRTAVFGPGLYTLLLGGTFTGVTVVRLQRISLALLTVCAVAWLAVLWRSRRATHPGAPFRPLIAAWSLAFGIAVIAAPSGRSLIALWYMAFYAALWLLLSDLPQRGLPAGAFSELLIIAALPLIFWALVQVLPWFPQWLAVRDLGVPFFPARPVSTLGNPNLVGAFLAMTLPFGIARWLSQPDRFGRFLLLVWMALAAGTLYLTFSRGAWLGAAAGVGGFSAAAGWRLVARRWARVAARWRVERGWARGAVVGAGVACSAALLVVAALSARALQSPQRETGARLGYFLLALDRFVERPATGTGLFTFGRELAAVESIPPAQPHAHAHNLALNVAAELGLPGLAALAVTAAWIMRALRQALRAAPDTPQRLRAAAAAGSITALAAHSLVDMPLMAPSLVMVALVALAAGVAPSPPGAATRRAGRSWARLGTAALWAVVLVTGWAGSAVYAHYVEGLGRVAAGDYRAAREALRFAADAQPWNAAYRAELAFAAGLDAGQGDRAAAQQSITAYQRALRLEPDQALWWANLAAVHWGLGQRAEAITALRRAVNTAPQAADLWLALGRYLEAAGDYRGALSAYQRALHLAPRMAAAAFWRQTPIRRAAQAIAAHGPAPESAARRLWLSGAEDEAIALLRGALTRDPAQPRPFIEIARLALDAGEVGRAESYLRAADALGPIGADAAWAELLRARIAGLRGDQAQAESLRQRAAAMYAPDATGYRLMYGGDTAQFQFLALTVPGKLLPALDLLGPEPAVAAASGSGQ